MEENKIRIGITQGDINGVGYEVILKTFADPLMFDLCTPIVYGSPKVAAYHRKSLDLSTNFSIVSSATEAADGRLNVVNCTNDEVKVEFSKADAEAGKAALDALEKAIEEYRNGLVDVIVTAPINKHTIHSEQFAFPGHTEYIEQRFDVLYKDAPVTVTLRDLLLMDEQVTPTKKKYALFFQTDLNRKYEIAILRDPCFGKEEAIQAAMTRVENIKNSYSTCFLCSVYIEFIIFRFYSNP